MWQNEHRIKPSHCNLMIKFQRKIIRIHNNRNNKHTKLKIVNFLVTEQTDDNLKNMSSVIVHSLSRISFNIYLIWFGQFRDWCGIWIRRVNVSIKIWGPSFTSLRPLCLIYCHNKHRKFVICSLFNIHVY